MLLFVAAIGLWIFWLDRIVFLSALSVKICLVASTVLAAVAFAVGVRRRNPRLKFTIMDSLESAISLLAIVFVTVFYVFSLLVFFSSTRPGNYVTHYEYDSGRKSCTGARVVDPDLDKRIKICQADALREGGKIRVEKLSGPLGIVVQQAHLL